MQYALIELTIKEVHIFVFNKSCPIKDYCNMSETVKADYKVFCSKKCIFQRVIKIVYTNFAAFF